MRMHGNYSNYIRKLKNLIEPVKTNQILKPKQNSFDFLPFHFNHSFLFRGSEMEIPCVYKAL